MKQLLAIKDSILHFVKGMSQRKLTTFASSGCYYLFMSLVPTVMILCCILPYTPFSQSLVLSYIDIYFAESLAEIIRNIVSLIYASTGATLTVSILLTLFSASASMRSLIHGINAAYDMEETDNFLVQCIKAIFYMIFLVAAILLALVIMVYGGRILILIRKYTPDLPILNYLLSKSRYLIIMVLLALFFAFLYRFMPAKKVRLLHQLPGAVFSAIVWVIFSAIFSWYVSFSNKYGAYGFIGTIMVAMMWMYYCLYFLLIGGYINSYIYTKRHGSSQDF